MNSELNNLSLDSETLNQKIREDFKLRNYRKANIDTLLKNAREEERKDKKINFIVSIVVISIFSVVATIFSL